MKLVYPAVLMPFEEGEGFTITVPDLPGCVSEGSSLADALLMGTDAASGWVLDELEDGKASPSVSRLSDVASANPEAIVTYLVLDMDSYAERYGKKAIRKNRIHFDRYRQLLEVVKSPYFSTVFGHSDNC